MHRCYSVWEPQETFCRPPPPLDITYTTRFLVHPGDINYYLSMLFQWQKNTYKRNFSLSFSIEIRSKKTFILFLSHSLQVLRTAILPVGMHYRDQLIQLFKCTKFWSTSNTYSKMAAISLNLSYTYHTQKSICFDSDFKVLFHPLTKYL